MSLADELHQRILTLAPEGVDPKHGDPESGSPRLWYRIRVPHLRELLKAWKQERGTDISFEEWWEVVDDFYHRPSIDARCFAGMLIAAFPTFRRELPLEQLECWLGELAGWKEVDNTCQSSFTAADLLAEWPAWQSFLRRLAVDENINKRRASLVLLVKPNRTGHPQIFKFAIEQVEQLKIERDPFITKAVSWVLRTAVKHHGVAVETYVDAHQASLPAIAVRETRRKIRTGKK